MRADPQVLLKRPVPGRGWQLGLHGASADFSCFSEALSVGRGGDANSALGVHLAGSLRGAAHYAHQSCRRQGRRDDTLFEHIHLVAYPQDPVYHATLDEFFCREMAPFEPWHPLHVSEEELLHDELVDPVGRFRQSLISQGYTSLRCDDVEGLGPHVVVLNPDNAVLVATVAGREAIGALMAVDGFSECTQEASARLAQLLAAFSVVEETN